MLPGNLEAELKSQLISSLDQHLGAASVTDMESLAEAVECFLLRYSVDTVREHVSLIVSGGQLDEQRGLMKQGDRYFDVVAAEDVVSSDTLQVAVLVRDPEHARRRTRSATIKMEGNGKYSRLRVMHSPSLEIVSSVVSKLVSVVFETGYRWLEAEVMKAIERTEMELARSLYSYLRVVIPDEEILGHVWFSSVSRDRAIYIFDEQSVKRLLDLAKARAIGLGVAPLRLVSEILTCFVPYELIAARHAIQRQQCIDIDLQESKYRAPDSLLVEAEMVLYGSKLISVFPLVSEGKDLLVAVFPSSSREMRENQLQIYRGELAVRFTRHQRLLEKLVDRLRSRGTELPVGKFGELMGGIVRGWVGN